MNFHENKVGTYIFKHLDVIIAMVVRAIVKQLGAQV
jgi:hypothetical protein